MKVVSSSEVPSFEGLTKIDTHSDLSCDLQHEYAIGVRHWNTLKRLFLKAIGSSSGMLGDVEE